MQSREIQLQANRVANTFGPVARIASLPLGPPLALDRDMKPHFSVSSTISLPNWAGDPGSGVPPRSARRAFILASIFHHDVSPSSSFPLLSPLAPHLHP